MAGKGMELIVSSPTGLGKMSLQLANAYAGTA